MGEFDVERREMSSRMEVWMCRAERVKRLPLLDYVWSRDSVQHPYFGFGARKHHLSRRFYSPHLFLSSLNVSFCLVVHPQAEESEANTETLRGVYLLVKPDNSNANDGDTLDERRDRIRDWRRCGKNRKCDDILSKMHRTIGEEIIDDAPCSRIGVLVHGYNAACRPAIEKGGEIAIEPNRDHHKEGDPG